MSCHCGNEKSYDECCQPFHKGDLAPVTAEELMRSRYSAFVAHEIDYIIDTHHADTSGDLDKPELERWAKESNWKSLEIVSVEKGKGDDETGVVEFKANYDVNGKAVCHHEKSFFKRDNEKWFYTDGDILTAQSVIRDQPKIGRNDPCLCGSGKKYKKCCL